MTQLSRRTLLAAGVSTISTASLLAGSAPTPASPRQHTVPGAAEGSTGTSALPTRSLYSGSVGALFTAIPLTAGGAGFRLRLAKILDLIPASDPEDEHRFSLIFHTTHPRFAEGIFSLRRDGVVTTELFLSAVDKTDYVGTQSIQAVINRSA